MKTVKVEIKSKKQSLGEFDYEYPETLEEALETDGEEKVYTLFAQQRKIRWMDAKRKELTGGGLPKDLVDKLKKAPKEVLEKFLAELDLDID